MRIPGTGVLRLAALVVIVLALVALTGCTGSASPRPDSGPGLARASAPPGSALPPLAAHDPPTAFARSGIGLPQTASLYPASGSVTLLGRTGFVASQTALQAIDLRTGAVLRTIRASGPPGSQSPVAERPSAGFGLNTESGPAPTVSVLGGRTVLLAAYLDAQPGHDAGAGSVALEIDVVNPESARRVRIVRVPVPGRPSRTGRGAPLVQGAVRIVGTSGPTIVLARRRANTTPITVAVSLTTQQRLWSATKLTPAAVYGHTLLASRTSDGTTHLVGLDPESGAARWSGDRALAGAPAVGGAEPGLALVAGTLYASGRHYLSLLHIASGAHRDIQKPSSQVPIYTCRYDLARTSICTGPTGERVLAVDAGSGKVLWRFGGPAHHARSAPSVTAALHGAVYATAGNGPVVLDARSGADRNQHPGLAPVLVNKYVGLARGPNGVLTIHRATG